MRIVVKAFFLNNQNQVLLLHDKNNHYDLPGGGVDEGEALEQACIRELEEETSYGSFEIVKLLSNNYPYYVQNNPDLKSLMSCCIVKLLDDTRISEVEPNTFEEWVSIDEILDRFGNKDTSRHKAMKNSIKDFIAWHKDSIFNNIELA